jgi:hypothetical protein
MEGGRKEVGGEGGMDDRRATLYSVPVVTAYSICEGRARRCDSLSSEVAGLASFICGG